MSEFDLSKIKEFYDRIPEIWAPDDAWHTYSHHELDHYIKQHMKLFEDTKVLNAGSGGNDYGIFCKEMYLDKDYALEMLKRYSYYSLISGYKKEFKNPDTTIISLGCLF